MERSLNLVDKLTSVKAKKMDLQKVPFWWLVLAAMTLNILAQAFHEGGHWIVFEITGHQPVWAFTSIVQLWDTSPRDPAGWLATFAPDGSQGWMKLSSDPGKTVSAIDDAAGPLVSLISVGAGLVLYRFNNKPALRVSGLILALITALLMTSYYARSGSHIGDEGFLAAALGISKMIFDIPLGIAFFTCLLLGLRELKPWQTGLRFMGALLLGMIPTAGGMVLSDPLIRAGVDLGTPCYQSVLGWSLPVFIVFCLATIGLILLCRKLKNLS
jgi:hypothetical protein